MGPFQPHLQARCKYAKKNYMSTTFSQYENYHFHSIISICPFLFFFFLNFFYINLKLLCLPLLRLKKRHPWNEYSSWLLGWLLPKQCLKETITRHIHYIIILISRTLRGWPLGPLIFARSQRPGQTWTRGAIVQIGHLQVKKTRTVAKLKHTATKKTTFNQNYTIL